MTAAVRPADGVDVSVIVVSYNTRELLAQCLRSIPEAAENSSYEVIVLDNASHDGSADCVAADFPDVRILRSEVNLGFAAGCNRAATSAKGSFLVLLNPDATLHPRALDALVHAGRADGDLALRGARIVDAEGEVDPRACFGLPSMWSLTCFATGLSTAFAGHKTLDPESLGRWERDDEREVGMLSGCCLLISHHLWKRLDGFDERFYMYSEDADLNQRARQIGAKPRLAPRALVTHLGGASSSSDDRRVLLLRGRATYLRRHWGRFGSRLGLVLLLVGVGLRAGLEQAARRRSMGTWQSAWRRRSEWVSGWPPAGSRTDGD
jgi:N-acetylglucosaminyl-diphospho-decaprenol L-rhamnosyltransferase